MVQLPLVSIMQIFENISLKGETEDDVCSLLHLVYKFSWQYYIWKYLKKTAVTYSIPTAVLQKILITTHCVALALTQ